MRAFRKPAVDPQMVPANRADVGALEYRRPAVRTTARRARRADTRCAHAAEPLSILISDLDGLLSQPNSAWPRMRDPAATVSEPALRFPFNTPLWRSSTLDAASMLPSSSPPMITVAARTPPVSLAPGSMVRLPFTWTSP